MPLQTIQLTLHQQVLLTLAVEEQVTDLRNRANNPDLTDLSTNAFLEDYQSLLQLIADVVAVQVETPIPEETPCAA